MTIPPPRQARTGLADLRHQVASGTERSVVGPHGRQAAATSHVDDLPLGGDSGGAAGRGRTWKRTLLKRTGALPGAA